MVVGSHPIQKMKDQLLVAANKHLSTCMKWHDWKMAIATAL